MSDARTLLVCPSPVPTLALREVTLKHVRSLRDRENPKFIYEHGDDCVVVESRAELGRVPGETQEGPVP